MSRCVTCLFVFLFVASLAWAGVSSDYRHHSLVQVSGQSDRHFKELRNYSQLDLIESGVKGNYLVAAFPEDLDFLTSHGYTYETIHEDLERYYADRARGEGHLDDMGGYHTFAEIVTHLDSLHTAHPNIVGSKFSVGTTIEGRSIWAVKISDNPDADENEPELFYNGLTHAREPEGMEINLYFMDWLATNYGTDGQATDLVNNREFFFIPCMNPDGYEYNRTTNPGGGGMWRKNRRNNGGSYGIDLNRNYGLTWGYDNEGSSPIPNDETYRGTAAFSEPETQAIRDFVNTRHFIASEDYHTYSNLILIPWGTSSFQGNGITEDDGEFRQLVDSMAYYIQQVNGAVYQTGTAWELLYNTNGGSTDWEYGDQAAHGKMFAISSEAGGQGDGFWPAPSRILPIARENLQANLCLARMAPNFMLAQAIRLGTVAQTETSGNNDGVIQGGETVGVTLNLLNTGLEDINSLTGLLSTSDPNATIIVSVSNWPNFAPQQTAGNTAPYTVQVSASVPVTYRIPCSLHLTASTGLDTTITIGVVVGVPLFTDNMESGTNGWTSAGSGNLWHPSTRRANSPTHSWYSGSEGSGEYNDNMNASLISPQFILSQNATLSFSHYYSLESNFDYGYVQINTGSGWIDVTGRVTGSSNGWRREAYSLGAFPSGSLAQVRFRMTSDAGTTDEGWYIDDVQIAPPPNIAVTPVSLTVGVAPGTIETRQLIVRNTGFSDLVYTTGFGNGGAATDTSAPDSYGYRYQTSTGPCGPTYTWLPISSSGTAVTFQSTEGDAIKGPYTLGFNVPFYGTSYGRLWVSANGWISFADSTTTNAINEILPSVNAGAGAICAWWDDLKPQLSGTNVRFWTNNIDSAAVHFENIRAGTSPNQGVYNFQILVTKYGEIKFFYGSMGTIRLTSATIGIQNPAKTVGLTWLNNQAGMTSSSAVRFGMGPRWISILPTSGVVQSGYADTLLVRMVGDQLCGTTDLTSINVRNNDPETPLLVVPVNVSTQVVPDVPHGLVIRRSGNDVYLRWFAAAYATGYLIERATDIDGPFAPVGTSSTLTFTDHDAVSLAGPLYYHVIATN